MLVASNLQAEPGQDSIRVLADDAGIAAHTRLIRGLGYRSANNDNFGAIPGDGCSESSVGRYSSGGTTSTTGGASILASIAGSGLDNLSIKIISKTGAVTTPLESIHTSLMAARFSKLLLDVGTPSAIPDRQPAIKAAISLEWAIFEKMKTQSDH